jgi:glycosyltransferase involved in cell wall biosynthesis
MWGYDLLDLGPARTPSQIPWATLVGMSWLRRGYDTPAARMEARLLELFGATASCRAFLQFDAYVNDGLEKAIWVPDLEDLSLPARPTERYERIRAHAGDRPCVGAFGFLSGYRCLDELLPLARAHPELRFALAGQLWEETVAEPLRPLLRPGALENLLVLPGFMESEEELNDAVRAADAIFIDGARYPTQSGVVSKAVELGKCVVTPQANSWVCDFVREHGVGVVYERVDDPIAEALARWKADGGEARSRAASAAVRDPRGVAACFDRLVAELAKGWEGARGLRR